MKRIAFFSLILALMLSSCAPSAYTMLVEMRRPSSSGLAPAGKDMGVLYLHSKDFTDTLFNNRVADALACSLEDDYFEGYPQVRVFSMERGIGAYDCVDSMAALSMELGADVLFVVDAPRLSADKSNPRILSAVYAYDTMGKDSVYRVLSRLEIENPDGHAVDSMRLLDRTELAYAMGERLSERFLSTWVKEFYTLYYFDAEKSVEAVSLAESMQWDKALGLWLELVNTKNVRLRGYCAYNISVACFMLGDYSLALEWIERSEADAEVPNAAGLKKRIQSQM